MLQPGFRDPVRQSQSLFRLAMRAMSSPGTIAACDVALAPPPPLLPLAAALVLTLCDFETPVWFDQPLAGSADVAAFLRFHTGARSVLAPAEAAFAVVAWSARLPALADFAQGTRDYPDRSTTLIVQVETLGPRDWRLQGPGVRDLAGFSAAPLPDQFVSQLRANRAQFPCGVDIFFVTRNAIAALPRSVRVVEAR
jgi:alpha-D-ribose 1-methylphosphonate 5-triphosphate synthase subunit PhnH